MEVWNEMIKNNTIGKMVTTIMNKIYEKRKFPVTWNKSVLHQKYKHKGGRQDRETTGV
jgi:hypothetical protein